MSPRPSPAPARPPQLPEELIFCSILPRLPVRFLARLTAVCKAWRDLILYDAAFAAMQAQSPSPASSALARFHNGRLEILGDAAAAASVAPQNPSLSFLTVGSSGHHYKVLDICACTGGLLCLTAVQVGTQRRVLCICNPATERVHRIWYTCPPGVVGLAYDPAAPAAERGYDVVVAAKDGWEACQFYWFSSRAAGSGWRTTRAPTLRLGPYEEVQPKPAYAGGRVHWFTSSGNIVWHDVAAVRSGVLPPAPCQWSANMDLAAWRGRLRLACATPAGLGVWELAGYGGGRAAARWEAVHWRSWSAIPGVIDPDRCFMWSVVPAGMVAGGEEALGLALRCAYDDYDGGEAAEKKKKDVWIRELVRYERGTGATAVVAELAGKEIHDGWGTVVCYHSSLAPLPRLNLDA
ncbi:unnamed protein product [Urochloa humidicola]